MKVTLCALFLFISIGNGFSQINNDYIHIGEYAPKIVGIDQFNTTIDSDVILKDKKILLLFYRGSWCPFCKKHLASLQENLKELSNKGVYVIVVTPEKVEKIQETTERMKAAFSVIHDIDNKIMSDYKVAFDVIEENVPNYFKSTLNKIREYNERENNVLPVPATYIIDQDHNVSYVHYDPNYKNRSDFKEILKNL